MPYFARFKNQQKLSSKEIVGKLRNLAVDSQKCRKLGLGVSPTSLPQAVMLSPPLISRACCHQDAPLLASGGQAYLCSSELPADSEHRGSPQCGEHKKLLPSLASSGSS